MKYLLIILFFSIFTNARSFDTLSSLERKSAKRALKKYQLEISSDYKNKQIGQIYVYVEEPFTKNQFLSFSNLFHVNTKESLIRKDLFITTKDIYSEEKIFDSEQTLKNSTRVFAFILPVKSINNNNDSKVIDLLIVSKDIISIYANCNFNVSSWSFNNLDLSFGETNFLGLNQKLIFNYNLDPINHAVDFYYFVPLLSGWQIKFRPGMYIGKDQEHTLGYYANADIAYPLRSFSDKWGFLASFTAYKKLLMDVRDNVVNKVKVLDKQIEKRYTYQDILSEIKFDRSFGYLYKKELYFGHKTHYKKSIPAKSLQLNTKEEEFFTNNYLPKNELESFVFIGTKYFENRFLNLYSYDTFSLQETLRLGFNADFSLDMASTIIASDKLFLRPNMYLSYTFSFINDGFLSINAFASSRIKGFENTRYSGTILLVAPQLFKSIRNVARVYYTETINNKDNLSYSLGSNTWLRGIKPRFFRGSKVFSSNLEARSVPLDLKIVQTGLIAFYDVGLAFNEWKKFNPTHSVGLGLRFLVPQLSNQVVSLDAAYPIYSSAPAQDRIIFSFNVGQKF